VAIAHQYIALHFSTSKNEELTILCTVQSITTQFYIAVQR